jgi:predicted Rossmann fold flavoprotein
MIGKEIITCDVTVIGGGPAGMMAAGTAAASGADTVLIEKNSRPGRKLLLTGKGRCNITNADRDPRSFLAHFGKKGRYLHSALAAFGVEDAIAFFMERGVPVKVERGDRVFPESDRAGDVLAALRDFMHTQGARVLTGHDITELRREDGRITAALGAGITVEAKSFILCTGGLSYPATGSTGAGYELARSLGHTIVQPRPSLVPVLVREKWVREVEGLSLRNVSVALFHDGKKTGEEFGEALFTSNGMSGPVILDLSRVIGGLAGGRTELVIDLKPALDQKTLEARVMRDFSANPTRLFKNSLGALLPASLIPVIVRMTGIDPDKTVSHITRDERKALVQVLKNVRLEVAGLDGFDKAIITAGGVSLDEIDTRTMKSRIVENLYFAGEIIDIDGPTGGFNLQVCWSTGFCAGRAAADQNA